MLLPGIRISAMRGLSVYRSIVQDVTRNGKTFATASTWLAVSEVRQRQRAVERNVSMRAYSSDDHQCLLYTTQRDQMKTLSEKLKSVFVKEKKDDIINWPKQDVGHVLKRALVNGDAVNGKPVSLVIERLDNVNIHVFIANEKGDALNTLFNGRLAKGDKATLMGVHRAFTIYIT